MRRVSARVPYEPMDGGPTFGQFLRGCRLGFRWHPILKAMVRIEAEGDHFIVQMCPPGQIPSGGRKGARHFAWWESDDGFKVFGLSRAIMEHTEPKSLIQIAVDDDGELA